MSREMIIKRKTGRFIPLAKKINNDQKAFHFAYYNKI